MNMQAILKQAQKMQKDMKKTEEEIQKMTFTGKSSMVSVVMSGTGKIISVNFDLEEAEKEDLEMLQDATMLAFNDAKKQLDKVTEEKMGAYTKGMPGLF